MDTTWNRHVSDLCARGRTRNSSVFFRDRKVADFLQFGCLSSSAFCDDRALISAGVSALW